MNYPIPLSQTSRKRLRQEANSTLNQRFEQLLILGRKGQGSAHGQNSPSGNETLHWKIRSSPT